MSVLARAVAGIAGALLLIGSIMFFMMIRPLNWETTVLGIDTAGLSGDLLTGVVRNRWPVSALLWLVCGP